MKTLVQTFLCPDCNSQVEIENETIWCNNCKKVASKSLCKEKASLKMVVINGNMISYKISVAHVLIEKLLTVTVSIYSTWEIAKKLISETFSFLINKSSECIQVSHWHNVWSLRVSNSKVL